MHKGYVLVLASIRDFRFSVCNILSFALFSTQVLGVLFMWIFSENLGVSIFQCESHQFCTHGVDNAKRAP